MHGAAVTPMQVQMRSQPWTANDEPETALALEPLRVDSWENHYEYAIFYRPHQNLRTIAHFKGNCTYFNMTVIIYYQNISLITKNIFKS